MRRIFSWIVAGVGVVCFAAALILSPYFMSHRPTQPHPESGMTYALQQHGGVVYLTYPEHLVMAVLPWAGILLLVAASAMKVNERYSGKMPG